VRELVGRGEVRVSLHGYEELADMNSRSTKRLVREGELVAEVEVNLLEAEGAWAPYLSVDDAYKLDDVRDALRAGDVKRASRLANRVYRPDAGRNLIR
jgi:hypothetical protein